VTPLETERTGVLVVRAWIESDAAGGLRARITRTLDLTTHDEITSTASTPAEITRVVVDWLDAFVREAVEVTER
jgi:hypothetical protein